MRAIAKRVLERRDRAAVRPGWGLKADCGARPIEPNAYGLVVSVRLDHKSVQRRYVTVQISQAISAHGAKITKRPSTLPSPKEGGGGVGA
jgi:hypothetical protein